MTARSGLAGLVTGLLASLLAYLLAIPWPGMALSLIAVGLSALAGGWWAGRWGGTARGRGAVLGGLAGGLAGSLVFGLWGAGAAGIAADATTAGVVRQTMVMFLLLFTGGGGAGALGGWLGARREGLRPEQDPRGNSQMALNAAITALPASIVATGLAALIFARLGAQVAVPDLVDAPLGAGLLLVLVSHLALAGVVPYEARRVEHRCGLDEVKMGAYVSIGAAPLLIVFLLLADAPACAKPWVAAALLVSLGLSGWSLRTLLGLILPRRAALPAPQDGRARIEANLFGTIATSRGPRLVVLCVGCGWLMVAPLYVCVVSIWVNLAHPGGAPGDLFRAQALISSGMIAASVAALTGVYLLYLGLGRCFNHWNAEKT